MTQDEIIEKVRALQKEKNLTLVEIARMVGISAEQLSQILRKVANVGQKIEQKFDLFFAKDIENEMYFQEGLRIGKQIEDAGEYFSILTEKLKNREYDVFSAVVVDLHVRNHIQISSIMLSFPGKSEKVANAFLIGLWNGHLRRTQK